MTVWRQPGSTIRGHPWAYSVGQTSPKGISREKSSSYMIRAVRFSRGDLEIRIRSSRFVRSLGIPKTKNAGARRRSQKNWRRPGSFGAWPDTNIHFDCALERPTAFQGSSSIDIRSKKAIRFFVCRLKRPGRTCSWVRRARTSSRFLSDSCRTLA